MSQNSRLNEEKTAIDRICFLPREKDSKTVRKVKKTNYSQEPLFCWLYFLSFYSQDSLYSGSVTWGIPQHLQLPERNGEEDFRFHV